MAAQLGGSFRVFSLDTGRLHPETYLFLQRVREHYDLAVEVFFPQPEAVEKLVRDKGLFSFYQDGHKECCGIRKVEPLVRALRPFAAWMTGQRRDQSPGTRAEIPVIQLDPTFSSPDRPLVKLNPLANWTSAQVWSYIRSHDVPHNALHERGFVSNRLRALHPPDAPGPARARGPLVVGGGDPQGVRPARRERADAVGVDAPSVELARALGSSVPLGSSRSCAGPLRMGSSFPLY